MKGFGCIAAIAALGLLVGVRPVPAHAGWFGLGESSKPSTAKEKKLPPKDTKTSFSKSKASVQPSAKKPSGGGSGWFGGLFGSKKSHPTKKAAGPAYSGTAQVPKQNKEGSSPLASLFGKKPSPR